MKRPVRMVTQIMLTLPVVLVGGCGTGAPPRQTALPNQPQPAATKPRPPGFIDLAPEIGSVPAKLKDEDYRRVTGDYAYADLEAVLKLIGRIRGDDREVSQVRFFERIAAAVTVGPTYSPTVYLCSKDTDGVWQVVSRRDSTRDYVH